MANSPIIRRPLPFKFYNASLIIIGINIAVFFITMTFPQVVRYIAMIPAVVVVY
ncbi:MAG: rhomboid family intramembrane serine protease, partial [Spirochaetales bacterium]